MRLDLERPGQVRRELLPEPVPIERRARSGRRDRRLLFGGQGRHRRSGIDRQRIVDMFRVIDWMMKLPKENDARFRQTVVTFEEDLRMRYVTSIERLAKEEGVEQGTKSERMRILTRLLAYRFGELPLWAREKLSTASDVRLDEWLHAVLDAESLEDALGG